MTSQLRVKSKTTQRSQAPRVPQSTLQRKCSCGNSAALISECGRQVGTVVRQNRLRQEHGIEAREETFKDLAHAHDASVNHDTYEWQDAYPAQSVDQRR